MPDGVATVREPGWVLRGVLAALGLVQLANGAWATLAPRSFYTGFPFGRGWVEALPAYNEHLMRDVGALFLAIGFVLAAAAWLGGRRLAAVALLSYLLFSVPHAAYHLAHLDVYGGADAAANVVALALTVLVPVGALWALARGGRRQGIKRGPQEERTG